MQKIKLLSLIEIYGKEDKDSSGTDKDNLKHSHHAVKNEK